jgi:hypothetical protein
MPHTARLYYAAARAADLRACATWQPMWKMAILHREAPCRPCTIAAARRDVQDVREWLWAQGVEPGF